MNKNHVSKKIRDENFRTRNVSNENVIPFSEYGKYFLNLVLVCYKYSNYYRIIMEFNLIP